MSNCVNRSHPNFKELLSKTDMNETLLAAKISIWQDKNSPDAFPSIEDITNIDSSQQIKYNEKGEVLAPNGKVSKLAKDIEQLIYEQNKNNYKIISTSQALSGNLADNIGDVNKRFNDLNDNLVQKVIELGGGKYAKLEKRLVSSITGATEAFRGKDKNYLTEIIKKEGQKTPILIRENGDILEGRHRLLALKNLGKKYVDVAILLDNNSKEAKQYEKDKQQILKLYKQTKTKAFKDWFGDSKVIDSNGEPLIVYHGSESKNIKNFNKNLRGNFTNTPSAQKGFFFTDNFKNAEYYTTILNQTPEHFIAEFQGDADANIGDHEAETALVNRVFELKKIKNKTTKQIKELEELENYFENKRVKEKENKLNTPGKIYPIFLSIQNPLIKDFKNNKRIESDFVSELNRIFLEDGAILKNTFDPLSTNVYVVFESNQIKSVLNKGEFSKNNDNIYYKDGSNQQIEAEIDKIIKDEVTYTDEENKLCAANGLTNAVQGTNWKLVKDFDGMPKHSQGGVDITISDKGVTMRRGGKDIKAAHGLVMPFETITSKNNKNISNIA